MAHFKLHFMKFHSDGAEFFHAVRRTDKTWWS